MEIGTTLLIAGDALDLTAILLLAATGVLLGRGFSRLKPPYWVPGYVIPMAAVGVFVIGNRFLATSFFPPMSWIVRGRRPYFVMAPVITMLFTLLVPRLRTRRERILVGILGGCFTLCYSALPLIAPITARDALEHLSTAWDARGVCRQTTDYTCGPAAAATALRNLGLYAEEGDLAVRSHCSPIGGTRDDCLADALVQKFGPQGLHADYRFFHSIDELPRDRPTVAVIKFNWLVDHFVTVLSVSPGEVVIADPAGGLRTVSRREFAAMWRGTGIVLSREKGKG